MSSLFTLKKYKAYYNVLIQVVFTKTRVGRYKFIHSSTKKIF